MAGLESSISAAEVGPIAGLQFQLPKVSSYVTSRTESYFVPSGNNFAPGGVRTMRVNASGNGFADLSSAVLEFTVRNDDATQALRPITSSGGAFFSELRVMCSGIEVERIGGGGCSYTRIEEALSKGLPIQKRIDQAGMAFQVATKTAGGATLDLFEGGVLETGSLGATLSTTVLHKPLFGLGMQHLYLPLWSLTGAGMTFEFMLHSSGADAVNSTVVAGVSGSTSWTISNVRLHMDILTVDEALMSSYAQHLLSGKGLVVPFRSYTNLSFQNSSKDTMLQIPRTFSRCNQVWVLCSRPASAALKDGNYFPAPTGAFDILESWIQVGSTKWPSNTYGPGVRAHYMRYLKALGYLSSGVHATSNSLQAYSSNSMLLIFDLERVPGSAMSGYNTHGGNMTVNLRGLGATDADAPSRIDILIWHDSLLEILDGSCTVSF